MLHKVFVIIFVYHTLSQMCQKIRLLLFLFDTDTESWVILPIRIVVNLQSTTLWAVVRMHTIATHLSGAPIQNQCIIAQLCSG